MPHSVPLFDSLSVLTVNIYNRTYIPYRDEGIRIVSTVNAKVKLFREPCCAGRGEGGAICPRHSCLHLSNYLNIP